MLEHTIETRNCTHCGASFDITDIDKDFLSRLTPTIGGRVYPIPFPKECPTCRKSRRYAWRNEHKIFKRKCDATGKEIISLFAPDAPCPVYASEYWYSDAWDARTYGRDFDFSRSFFTQWAELKRVVPMPGKTVGKNLENSEYSDNCGSMKDCYLCFNAENNQNCHYSVDIWGSNDCLDCMSIASCQSCYELQNAIRCYETHYSFDVKDCKDSYFLYDCDNCESCYGCYDQKNQHHMIFNTQYSPEEYADQLSNIQKLSITNQRELVYRNILKANYTIKPPKNIGTENIYNSEEVHDSKNIYHSKIIRNSEDIRYGKGFYNTKLVMDGEQWGNNLERGYEVHQIGENSYSLYFTGLSWGDNNNLFYCLYCINNVHHCFGCVGLRNSEYCILNKQYTKEEYESLVPKIIEKMMADGEWGEFFPRGYSHFGYNHTMNMDKYPLTREVALEEGYYWSHYEAPPPTAEKIIPGNLLPDDISGIPDDILNWVIECSESGKVFRIVKPELEFYRKHHLPIPRKHPDERYRERSKIYINY